MLVQGGTRWRTLGGFLFVQALAALGAHLSTCTTATESVHHFALGCFEGLLENKVARVSTFWALMTRASLLAKSSSMAFNRSSITQRF